MSKNQSSKSLALFVTNSTISFLTKTTQQEEQFYSDVQHIKYISNYQSINIEEIRHHIKTTLPLLLYYDQVYICYQSTPCYLVPTTFFKKELLNNYLLNTKAEFVYSYNQLKSIDAQFIFNIDLPVHEIFEELPNLKQAHYLHSGELLINNVKVNKEKIQIFTQIINQKLELCIYKNGIFMLYNIFDLVNDDDLIYYILNTAQQLELDPTQIEVYFESGLTPDNTIASYLEKYVQQIHYNKQYELLGSKHLLYKIFECE